MRNYIIVLGFLALIACNQPNTPTDDVTTYDLTPVIMASHDSITFQDILSLKKDDAIKQYAQPIKRLRLLLDDMYGEFWISVYDKYSDAERQSQSIYIEELTWEKDKEHFITAWYQENEKNGLPKAYLIWDKGSEF